MGKAIGIVHLTNLKDSFFKGEAVLGRSRALLSCTDFMICTALVGLVFLLASVHRLEAQSNAVPGSVHFVDDFEGPTLAPFWNYGGGPTDFSPFAHGGQHSLHISNLPGGPPPGGPSHLFPQRMYGTVSVWMYDRNDPLESTSQFINLDPCCTVGYTTICFLFHLPHPNCDDEQYVTGFRLGPGGVTLGNRSTGWHQFQISASSSNTVIALDGVQVYTRAGGLPFNRIDLGGGSADGRGIVPDLFFDDFSCDVFPANPDLIANSLSWDATQGGVNFSYEAKGTALTNATTAKVFWANETNVANILSSTAIFTNGIPVGFTGASPTNHVPAANLLNAPPKATHLLLVVDPDHLVTESNTNNNTLALAIADGLFLASTLSGERREIFASANGTVIKYEEPGDEGEGYDIFSVPTGAPAGVYFSPLTQPPFGPNNFPSVNMDSAKVTDAVDPNVYRYQAMGDKRTDFLVNDLPPLLQGGGNWAAAVLNPKHPPKDIQGNVIIDEPVSNIGCVLTILSMAAKYTARDPAKIKTLFDDGAINSVTGDIADWLTAFYDLQKFSKDSEYKLVPAATFLGINVQISVAPGEPPDSTAFFNDLENTMRANSAAAILQVPSLSDPNNSRGRNPPPVHFVLCVGVENDQGANLPLKRFRIYDPGRHNFIRSDTIPIRYLDQHFDNLLRRVDFKTDAVLAVRFFVVPNKVQPGSLSAPKRGPTLSGLASRRKEAGNSSPASTYLSYSVPADADVMVLKDGVLLNLSGQKIVRYSDSSEDIDDPDFPGTGGTTTYILNPAPGNYSFVASNSVPLPVEEPFWVTFGGGEASPTSLPGTISTTNSTSTISVTVSEVSSPVALQITLLSNQAVVSWPSSATGFVLETTETLSSGGSWLPLTNGVVKVGNYSVLTNSVNATATFYRLTKP
ncbi:MAG: hypothetical protein HY043_08350 [Verrucomicrobia bacterium]|nr:hypothetical protein [Verrucomicrobiota bacterium]